MTLSLATRQGGNALRLSIALCGTLAPSEGSRFVPVDASALAETPDATLLALGRAWTAMDQRCAGLDAAPDRKEQSWAARAMRDAIGRRIDAATAQTIEGMGVKALLSDAMFDA